MMAPRFATFTKALLIIEGGIFTSGFLILLSIIEGGVSLMLNHLTGVPGLCGKKNLENRNPELEV